uniref:Uncharacterized protein n=1 Tax=Arundo donax TaxID=35708 RepID=A0A0A8Z3Q8_ARUDO
METTPAGAQGGAFAGRLSGRRLRPSSSRRRLPPSSPRRRLPPSSTGRRLP